MSEKIPVYAVVRIDEFASASRDETITITEILPTAEEAMKEVERLNKLHADTRSHYFWQHTRYYPHGRTHGGREVTDEN